MTLALVFTACSTGASNGESTTAASTGPVTTIPSPDSAAALAPSASAAPSTAEATGVAGSPAPSGSADSEGSGNSAAPSVPAAEGGAPTEEGPAVQTEPEAAGGAGGTAAADGGSAMGGSSGRAGASGLAGNTPGGGGGAEAEGEGTGGVGGAGNGGGGTGDSMQQSSGCGQDPTLTSGERTIESGGQSRSYILSIPDGYDNNRPYRLFFAYHWRGGTMQDVDGGGTSGDAWSYYGLREQADDSAIFVAPQGIGNGWANSGGQDLTFTDDMLALITDDLCVDRRQIFALGFSYGGGMSYALACARPDVFRAVAVYSGGVLSGCEGGTEPVAYMGIHGLGDGTLNISGGRSMRDRFVTNNGCTPQDPPEPSAGSLTHTCTAYQGCTAGYPVEWCAFDGGHTPGVVDGGGDDGARTWTKTEVWRFFTQFE